VVDITDENSNQESPDTPSVRSWISHRQVKADIPVAVTKQLQNWG